MKKALCILTAVLISSLFLFSLSFADWANYAAPQLEYITNAFPILWNKPKEQVQQIMSIFPDFIGTDYGDQLVYTSKYNYNDQNNIYINFFMDDYEEHHDNLWKVTLTLEVQKADQTQDLFAILWIDGLKPFHSEEDEFWFRGVQPLYFSSEDTTMVAWFQPFKADNNPFFLVEYYNGSIH